MLGKLPKDVLLYILSFLTMAEKGRASLVSMQMLYYLSSDELWKDEKNITKGIIEKTKLSAKTLQKRFGLFTKGNCFSLIRKDCLKLSDLENQVAVRLKQVKEYNIGFIRSHTILPLAPVLTEEGFLSWLEYYPDHRRLSITIMEHVVAGEKRLITTQNLNTQMGLQGYPPTINSDFLKDYFKKVNAILIFSNSSVEVKSLCDTIKKLCDNDPVPFIFVATFDVPRSDLNEQQISEMNVNITELIRIDKNNNLCNKQEIINFDKRLIVKLDKIRARVGLEDDRVNKPMMRC